MTTYPEMTRYEVKLRNPFVASYWWIPILAATPEEAKRKAEDATKTARSNYTNWTAIAWRATR